VLRDLEPDIPRTPIQPMVDVIGGGLARPGFYAAAVASSALTGAIRNHEARRLVSEA
jgi:hypothetical protein